MSHVWTKYQISFLKSNYNGMTNKEIADKLNIPLPAVRHMGYKLGFKRMELQYWTKEQVKFLRLKFRTIGDTELADIFNKKWIKSKGWTKKHIEKKRKYLNLNRTPVEIAAIRQRNVKNGLFAECPKRAWATRGEAEIGTVKVWRANSTRSARAYIKTDTGYHTYARYYYRQNIGRIPNGMIVRIKNPLLPVSGENLELITRAENGKRNSIYRYPKELRETIKLNNTLKKLINEKQN